jgi:predicted nucleic acid-binding protein
MIVFLDSSIVYSLINTSNVKEVIDCQEWFYTLLSKGVLFISSAICEYEVKRELIRRNKIEELNNLNELKKWLEFLPIDETVLDVAAINWAKARNTGIPTADNKSLDADMIICSTYQLLQEQWRGRYIVIATKNIKHLSHFSNAQIWQDINF